MGLPLRTSNPAFIELNGRGSLGWLEGFNEMVTPCGYEWVGHPSMDKGVMLPSHGLAANIPASKVVLSIDEDPAYTIRLKGDLKEQAFKLVNFVIATKLSTEASAQQFLGRHSAESRRALDADRSAESRQSRFPGLFRNSVTIGIFTKSP